MGKLYVGTSGWSYREWKPDFYPEDIPQKRWLEHYCSELTACEEPSGLDVFEQAQRFGLDDLLLEQAHAIAAASFSPEASAPSSSWPSCARVTPASSSASRRPAAPSLLVPGRGGAPPPGTPGAARSRDARSRPRAWHASAPAWDRARPGSR